ncbi:MAG UNVERIFIED_CONTAM: hypothetical protein LVT10_21685 [Anaerolineae bacterium]
MAIVCVGGFSRNFHGDVVEPPKRKFFPDPTTHRNRIASDATPPVPTAVMLSTPVTTTPTSYREALVGRSNASIRFSACTTQWSAI